jgi:hypothetical protein
MMAGASLGDMSIAEVSQLLLASGLCPQCALKVTEATQSLDQFPDLSQAAQAIYEMAKDCPDCKTKRGLS